MPELPTLHEGDRIRVTYEATVTAVDGPHSVLRAVYDSYGMELSSDLRDLISVEKIQPPLPTKPHAVIFADTPEGRKSLHRGSDGDWISTDGYFFAQQLSNVEVIFNGVDE